MFNRAPPELRLGRRSQLTLDPGLELDPALSPDGKLVAYTAGPLGQTRLYVRQVDGATPVAITSTEAGLARVPRWSPDGSRLLFLSSRGLEAVPALGGPAKLLVPVARGAWADGTWSPDGRSIAYARGDSVYVLAVEGGAARGLARLAEAHSCDWSPDGRWLACASGNRRFVGNEDFGNIALSSVWIVPAAGGTPVRVTEGEALNTSPAWLPGGRSLVYISDRDGGRDIYQVALGRDGQPSARPGPAHDRSQRSAGERLGGRTAAVLHGFHSDIERLVAPCPALGGGSGKPGGAGDAREPGGRELRRFARRSVARLRLRSGRRAPALPDAARRW